MSTEGSGNEINRRRFLRRAAAVGAAAAWATPVVRTITGSPAFAQGVAGSPIGDGDYSLTICYAIAAPTGGTGDTGSGGRGAMSTQETDQTSCVDPTQGGPGAEYFSVSTAGGGDDGGGDDGGGGRNSTQSVQTIQVSLTPTGVAAGARIVSASADCGPGTVSPAGDYATITCAG